MKAIRVHTTGGPDVLELAEVDDLVPRNGQVVVRIQNAGVNPVDTYIRRGAEGYNPRLPYTPGFDGAGVVESVGKGIDAIAPGDRVYVAGSETGTYAELVVATEQQVYPLPDCITHEQGAAIGVPYATAYRGLFHRAGARPGEVVLVHGGTGGVGVASVQLALAAGLTVLATAGTQDGMDMLTGMGVDKVFDHTDPEYLQQVFSQSGEHGVDVILEMLANVNLSRDLTILARGGRVVVIGSRGLAKINPRDAMTRDASIVGMSLMNMSDADLRSVHAALVAGMRTGAIRPVIGETFPLANAADAHRAVMAPGRRGKIILHV